jgi:hypothetical protein
MTIERAKGSAPANEKLRRYVAAIAAGSVLAAATPLASGQDWQVPRTSWGDPDLTGYWTNRSLTRLERPAEFAGKAFFTEDELAAWLEKELNPDGPASLNGEVIAVHYDLDDYGLGDSQNPLVHNLRTSLIVDPPDGRLPAMTPEAEQRAAAYRYNLEHHQWDSVKNAPLSDRCIVWESAGPPIVPRGYNNLFQIFQTEAYVVVVLEMNHDARIIPLDGRAHVDEGIVQYLGDARGHWDGETLVVETTNFNDQIHFDGQLKYSGTSEELIVTERFTHTGDNRILYEFTVDDPKTWERPWSGEVPVQRTEAPMFEFACHEGNYGLANTLSGARADERKAAAAAESAR